MYDIIKCSSIDCPYESSCYRKLLIEPFDNNPTWYDYSWQCDYNSGYQDYIKVITNNTK